MAILSPVDLPPLTAWHLRPLALWYPKQLRQELLQCLSGLLGPRVVGRSAHQPPYRVAEIVLTNDIQKRSLLFKGGHCRLSPPRPVASKSGRPKTRPNPPPDLLSQYQGTLRAVQLLKATLKARWAALPLSGRDLSKWTVSRARQELHRVLDEPRPLEVSAAENEILVIVRQRQPGIQPFSLPLQEFWSGGFSAAELAEGILAAGCGYSVASLRRDLRKARRRARRRTRGPR